MCRLSWRILLVNAVLVVCCMLYGSKVQEGLSYVKRSQIYLFTAYCRPSVIEMA